MPIYSPALDFIINVGDKSAAGLLALSGSRVVAAPPASSASHRIIRADSRFARVRACVPNLSGERAFDDVDLSASTVQLAIGIPGANPYCLATLDTAFPVAAAQVTTPQSATADLPATKRVTLDPPPYGGTWLLNLDDLDPIELPWDAEAGQLAALAGPAYSIRRRATNAWEISGTEPNQDLTISVDVSGLLVPSGLSGEIELNTVALAAAFAAAATGTPPSEPKWLRVTREIIIDGEAVFQDDKLELAREVLNLTSLVPAPVPPSDYAALAALIAAKQPVSAQLTALAAISGTAWGRALLALSDAGALRTYASLQPLSAQLTAIAVLTGAAYGRGLLTQSSAAAVRSYIAAALDSATVHNTGDETVAGIKTFSSAPVVPSASFPQAAIADLVSDLSTLNSQLSTKAPLASPDLTGTPTAPTPVNATSSTQLATTAFVHALLTDLVNASPSTLDTLKELADAIGDDPNFAVTVAASIAAKLSKASNLSDLTDAADARTNLGLGNVNNTADSAKPVSTAQATADAAVASAAAAALSSAVSGINTALSLKASLAGDNTFTGENIFTLLQTFNSIAASNLVVSQLGDPGAPTVTPIGSDEGATWSYKIVAKLSDGTASAAGAAGTTTHGDQTLDATNRNSLAWTAVPGAASYDVYRTAVGISPATTGKIANVSTNAYVDSGAAGDSTTPPAANATGGMSLAGPFTGFRDKGGQVFNVTAYGAVCDGVTDDTAAVQAAIAACEATGRRGTVLISDGMCVVSAIVIAADHITLAGTGWNTGLKSKLGTTSDRRILLNGNFCTIRDMTIDGQSASISTGANRFILISTHDNRITNVCFRDTFDGAIGIFRGFRNTIDHCLFRNIGDGGVSIFTGVTSGADEASDNAIEDNRFIGMGHEGVRLIDGCYRTRIVRNLFRTILFRSTIAAPITASASPQVVTPAAMSGVWNFEKWAIEPGMVLYIDPPDPYSYNPDAPTDSGTEYVTVLSVTDTTFTAIFSKDHSADVFIGQQSLNSIQLDRTSNFCVVSQNIISGGLDGIDVLNGACFNSISHNVIQHTWSDGIALQSASDNSIDANLVVGCLDTGINLTTDCNRNQVTGNKCWNNSQYTRQSFFSSSTHFSGIFVSGDDNTVTGNISGDDQEPPSQWGLKLDTGAERTLVAGNKLFGNVTNFIDGGDDTRYGYNDPVSVFAIPVSAWVTSPPLANNATWQPFGSTNNFAGPFWLQGYGGIGSCCDFKTGDGIVVMGTPTAANFSTIQGTSSKVNVYILAGVVTVENKTGGAINLRALAAQGRTTN